MGRWESSLHPPWAQQSQSTLAALLSVGAGQIPVEALLVAIRFISEDLAQQWFCFCPSKVGGRMCSLIPSPSPVMARFQMGTLKSSSVLVCMSWTTQALEFKPPLRHAPGQAGSIGNRSRGKASPCLCQLCLSANSCVLSGKGRGTTVSCKNPLYVWTARIEKNTVNPEMRTLWRSTNVLSIVQTLNRSRKNLPWDGWHRNSPRSLPRSWLWAECEKQPQGIEGGNVFKKLQGEKFLGLGVDILFFPGSLEREGCCSAVYTSSRFCL